METNIKIRTMIRIRVEGRGRGGGERLGEQHKEQELGGGGMCFADHLSPRHSAPWWSRTPFLILTPLSRDRHVTHDRRPCKNRSDTRHSLLVIRTRPKTAFASSIEPLLSTKQTTSRRLIFAQGVSSTSSPCSLWSPPDAHRPVATN